MEHTKLLQRGRAGGRSLVWRGYFACICKNNLQYAKGERRFSSGSGSGSHHLWYAAGAVTPAAATAIQVAVAYGGRLLRFRLVSANIKLWKTLCDICLCILYYLRTFLLFEHTSFILFSCSKCVFCIRYIDDVFVCICMYVCMLPADRFVCYAEFSFPLSLRRPCTVFVIGCFVFGFVFNYFPLQHSLFFSLFTQNVHVRLSLFIALIMHLLRQLATFMPEIAVLLGSNRQAVRRQNKNHESNVNVCG